MRELLITRMVEMTRDSDDDCGRWDCIKEWIATEIMGRNLTVMKTKTIRKITGEIRLANLPLIMFTANATDEQVIKLFELVVYRRYTQR